MSALDRTRARLVSGPLGRGIAFATDFAIALIEGAWSKVRNWAR